MEINIISCFATVSLVRGCCPSVHVCDTVWRTLIRNKDPNEFWLSLIEKAYAKMHGCYEVLDAGFMNTCLVDLTGAAPGEIDIKDLFAACKDDRGRYDKEMALNLLSNR